ncbi:SAM-dependent methyltransferase [Nocardia transvalensis]|uniref:SAM-dependent methyltransferase n=1 Tax=Nocardia transvalensis TaxID=37333 RepID=A0A7W9P9E1_9NOCA|nr:class I SAM-dependent methyltransferase [Nocardia transvalensis]MBB5911932.1 SAM-dependent methyltransferase [Nocardia transvalensis]
MPTLPSESPAPSDPEPHRQRHIAESFGVDAERYDRARPRYPDDLIDRIATRPGLDLLDVGCGTGIAARQLRDAGCRVLGVEPDKRMAAQARRTGIETEVATFEDWDPAGREFDMVTAAQSWHWVDPVAGAIKAARILRPGGRLALFAHVIAPPQPIALAQMAAIRRLMPDSPFATQQGDGSPERAADVYRAGMTKFIDGIREAGGFGSPEEWRFDWQHSYTRAEWLDLAPTTGALTRLPQPTLTELLDEVGEAIDALGGTFTMTYVTLAVSAVREPADT